MSIRIAMWSGPRNLSTAMMRSFGSRADTFVSDEPFYGCFLKHTGAAHPMREETIESMDCDWKSVMATLAGDTPDGSPIWYQKHMWHHMTGPVGYDDFTGFRHGFLIREPERMIASYLRKRETAAFEDFGLERQAEFFDREAQRLGHAPPVIDANDVLANPQAVLSKLCEALGIPWDAAMLRWAPGRRETDGIWAAHWYNAVERSTGFGPPEVDAVELEPEDQRLADRIRPYYERLAAHRISMNHEECLRGGRTTAGVVRIGDTTRRPTSSNSDVVSALLVYLRQRGFNAAPDFLGFDDQGRMSLSYVEGRVPPELGLYRDDVLCAAARLIRQYHDSTRGFFGGSVACHNDLSPCNFVFVDDLPAAIIDFDGVAPGSAEWDLGYAAWLWLDIGNDEISPEEQLRRLELFARAYDPELSGNELVTPMIERQRLLAAEPGDAARQVWATGCLAWTVLHLKA